MPAVGPRAHQGAHRPPPAGAQADEVLEGGARVGVVPAAHQEDRHVGDAVPVAAEVHARVLPVVVVVGAGEDLERPLLVGRHEGELGLAGADGHALEPVGEARGALVERGLHVGRRGQGGLGVVGRMPEGPGEEAQLERAAVADAALVAVGAAHVRHHGGEPLGPQRGHGGLRPAGPRGAEGAHRAVAPRPACGSRRWCRRRPRPRGSGSSRRPRSRSSRGSPGSPPRSRARRSSGTGPRWPRSRPCCRACGAGGRGGGRPAGGRRGPGGRCRSPCGRRRAWGP